MIKTAVIGASGYIGHYLWKSYRDHFPDCIGTTFSKDSQSLHYFDIRQPDISSLKLAETDHECVIIASAKPNITYCEQNKDLAYDVNVRGTLALAHQIEDMGLPAIFLSTDYVFEGTHAPYKDTDSTNPTTEYGRQKLIVEKALPEVVSKCLVLRLSKIYGTQKGDRTLLDDIGAKLASGCEFKAATDQMFCPTYIRDLIDVIHGLQSTCKSGVLNLCNPNGFSRYEIASLMSKAMGLNSSLVEPILLDTLPEMNSRPLDTRLYPSTSVMEMKPIFSSLEENIEKVSRNWTTK
jgi:dTDP-4-dehydrorhamnose reductase